MTTDLKAAAEAAKAATAAYIADPTDRETGRQWDRACAEFSLACTEDAILALIRERDEARAVWCQCATAALAAMGEREPVAWEHFRDESYFDLWCVRPTGERTFGVGFHVTSEAEAIALVETLAGKASPRPEAGEAIRSSAEPPAPAPLTPSIPDQR